MLRILLSLALTAPLCAQEGFLLDTTYPAGNRLSVNSPGQVPTPTLRPRSSDKPLPAWGFDTRIQPNAFWQQGQFWEDHVPLGTGHGRIWWSRNYVNEPWADTRLFALLDRLECVIPNIRPWTEAECSWNQTHQVYLQATTQVSGALDVRLGWELANADLPIAKPPEIGVDLWLNGSIDFQLKAPYGRFYESAATEQLWSQRVDFLPHTPLGLAIQTSSDPVHLHVDAMTGYLGEFNMYAWVWFFPDKGTCNLAVGDYDDLKVKREISPSAPAHALGDLLFDPPYRVDPDRIVFCVIGRPLAQSVPLAPGYFQGVSLDHVFLLTADRYGGFPFRIRPPLQGTYQVQVFETNGTYHGTRSTRIWQIN